jgi:monoamine oxidase
MQVGFVTTIIMSTSDGVQEYKFVGGSMQISEKLAALLGDRVVLDQPVIRVEQTDKGVTVATANGTTYTVSRDPTVFFEY